VRREPWSAQTGPTVSEARAWVTEAAAIAAIPGATKTLALVVLAAPSLSHWIRLLAAPGKEWARAWVGLVRIGQAWGSGSGRAT
jgi:hypothetical protein